MMTPQRPDRRATRAAPAPAAPWDPPGWLAPAIYLVTTLALFRDFVAGDEMLFGVDTLALGYFARDFFAQFVRSYHEFPLWNPLIFGGLPFMEGLHGDVFYPTSVLLFLQDTHRALGWKLLLHVFLAGVFMNAWLRALGIGAAAALFGGLVYMLGSFMVSLVYPGHDGKLFVTALTPLLFLLVERAATGRRVTDFAWIGIGVALLIYTPHMQLAYYALWAFSFWFFARLWRIWRAERSGAVVARLFGLFAVAGLLGAAPAPVQLLPPFFYLREYSHRADKTVHAEAERGIVYSSSWSLHPEEAASLIVPDFVGTSTETRDGGGDTYWGRNLFKLNHEYAGLIPLLLLPLAFILRRPSGTWFFAGLGIIALLYALGLTTPAFRLFYLIPGVSMFRAPSSAIFLSGFAVVTLGSIGLQRLLETRPGSPDARAARKVLWSAAGALLVLALAASAGLLIDLWQNVLYRDMSAARSLALDRNLAPMQAGFWIAFLLAALTAGAAEARFRGLIGWRGLTLAILLLAALDLWRVDRRFILTTDPALYFGADETVRFLQNRQAQGEVFRVFDLGSLIGGGARPNYYAAHGLEELAGHHGNELGAYRDLIGGEHPVAALASEFRLLDIANVRFLITPRLVDVPGYEPVFQGERVMIYENLGALPRAYLVGSVEVVGDDDAARHLLAPDFPYHRSAILAKPLPAGMQLKHDVAGDVEWLGLQPGRMVQGRVNVQRLQVTADGPALLVVSENYHHGWHARVNGEPVTLLRVNRTFRGVSVPAGRSVVEFRYGPPLLRVSAMVTIFSLMVLAGAALSGWLRSWRRPA
jgi:hypothetical protein